MNIRPLCVICMLLISGPAVGEADPDNPATSSDRPRSALLAEGSIVVDLKGTMVRSPDDHLWYFRGHSETRPGDQPLQQFTLLPCRLLEDMERRLDGPDGSTGAFSLTGEVLTYRGENWLLPQHVVWLTDHARRAEPTEEPAGPEEAGPDGDRPSSPRDQGDSIADIVADLQASVGPLRRSVDDRGEPATAEVAPDGRRLVSRRGRLGRGPTGAWIFILDADTTGLRDPSLVLLPSSRLGQLESYAGYGWMGKPMLMSGEIFTYRGRRFLRPTSFTIVQERPNLIR